MEDRTELIDKHAWAKSHFETDLALFVLWAIFIAIVAFSDPKLMDPQAIVLVGIITLIQVITATCAGVLTWQTSKLIKKSRARDFIRGDDL